MQFPPEINKEGEEGNLKYSKNTFINVKNVHYHLAIFNQIPHLTDFNVVHMKGQAFSMYRWLQNRENTMMILKNMPLKNH